MSKYKLTLTRIDKDPDGVPSPNEVTVYTQHFDDLNVSELIRDLNKPRRVRKPRTARNPNLTPG